MLVIPHKPVHVLLFSQPGLKGNAKSHGNHLPKRNFRLKACVYSRCKSKEVWFSHALFAYSCGLLTVRRISRVAQVQQQMNCCLLMILKITFSCLGRTLRQVMLHNGEFLRVLPYWPLHISSLNQRYFPIINSYCAV